jgi:hypothetical protein
MTEGIGMAKKEIAPECTWGVIIYVRLAITLFYLLAWLG